jgi:hypothetical protein
MARINPDGVNLEWVGVDRDGHLGFFTSQGSRLVPEPVLESDQTRDWLMRKVAFLPRIGKGSRAWFVGGDLEFGIRMAQRGFFAYRLEACRHGRAREGHYRRVAKPSRPLRVESLDDEVRRWIVQVTFGTVCFAWTRTLEEELLR